MQKANMKQLLITLFAALLTWSAIAQTRDELYSVRANHLYQSSRNEVIMLTTEEPIVAQLEYIVYMSQYNQEAFR